LRRRWGYPFLQKRFSPVSPWYVRFFSPSPEVHATCSAKLNLKNDLLRRRFDSLKYDIKKIEEGEMISHGPEYLCDRGGHDTVVYDVSLRKLVSSPTEKSMVESHG
jgi:hypothetical protein